MKCILQQLHHLAGNMSVAQHALQDLSADFQSFILLGKLRPVQKIEPRIGIVTLGKGSVQGIQMIHPFHLILDML